MSAIETPEKKRRGCFFYGCITLICVGLVIAVAVFFVLRYFVSRANGIIAEYSEAQPVVFQKVGMPDDELKKLQDRVTAFSNEMNAHSNGPPLVLSSRDVNALMFSVTNFKDLKDMVRVDIEGGKIRGQVSLPLENFFQVPFVHTKGRYLNGTGTFTVGVVSNLPAVYIQTLEVKGKSLPSQFMMQVKGKNMAEDFENSPTNSAKAGQYDSIEVKDGNLVIKAKAN